MFIIGLYWKDFVHKTILPHCTELTDNIWGAELIQVWTCLVSYVNDQTNYLAKMAWNYWSLPSYITQSYINRPFCRFRFENPNYCLFWTKTLFFIAKLQIFSVLAWLPKRPEMQNSISLKFSLYAELGI